MLLAHTELETLETPECQSIGFGQTLTKIVGNSQFTALQFSNVPVQMVTS